MFYFSVIFVSLFSPGLSCGPLSPPPTTPVQGTATLIDPGSFNGPCMGLSNSFQPHSCLSIGPLETKSIRTSGEMAFEQALRLNLGATADTVLELRYSTAVEPSSFQVGTFDAKVSKS